jgi:Transposase DDE domain
VLVDTLGLLLKVVVHPADLHDRLGAKLVLGALGSDLPRLQHIWADQGYAGALRQQQALQEAWKPLGGSAGYTEEELGECLLALDRPDEARPYFARHMRSSRETPG